MKNEYPSERENIPSAQVRWQVLVAFLLATAAILLAVPLARETSTGSFLKGAAWWENLNLFLILLLVTVGGVAMVASRLRLRDLGVRADKLIEGVIVTLIAWGAMQAWPFLASGTAELAHTWNDAGLFSTLRWAAVMFLITALWEEIAFRGFLLPQLYLKLRGHHHLRLWGALILSQIVFACAHLPAHIMIRELSGGALLQMLALQGFAGILLGLVYLRTRNLWIAIGIHGLANAPTPLVGGAMGWELPLLTLVLLWPWLTRRPDQRGFAAIDVRQREH